MLVFTKIKRFYLFVFIASSFLFIQTDVRSAFTPPSATPPNGNVGAPILSDGEAQTLTGSLTVISSENIPIMGQLDPGGASSYALYGVASDAGDYAGYITGGKGLGIAPSTDIWFEARSSGISWPRVSDGADLYGIWVTSSGELEIRGHGGGITLQDQNQADLVFVQEDGDVGIGILPDARLHVSGRNGSDQRDFMVSSDSPEIILETDVGDKYNWRIAIQEDVNQAFEIASGNSDNNAADDAGADWNNRFVIEGDTGDVGIGTTGPNYRLDIQGGQLNASGGVCINGDCKTAWSQVGGSQWSDVTGGIDYTGGNVGIGVSGSPGADLHVVAPDPVIKITDSTGGDNNATLWLQEGDSFGVKLQYQSNSNDFFSLRTVDSGSEVERLVVNRNGNVGIGASLPQAKLSIDDGTGSGDHPSDEITATGILIEQESDNLYLGVRDYGSNRDDSVIIFGDDSQDNLRIQYNAAGGGISDLLIVQSDGDTGIGTTNPGYKLEVVGQINSSGGLCIGGDCKTAWSEVMSKTYEYDFPNTSGTNVNGLDSAQLSSICGDTNGCSIRLTIILGGSPYVSHSVFGHSGASWGTMNNEWFDGVATLRRTGTDTDTSNSTIVTGVVGAAERCTIRDGGTGSYDWELYSWFAGCNVVFLD